MGIIQNTLEQGLIYAIMALGVLITYSILDFPDLSVDGTFPLGAAVSALMITRGQSPALALLCAMAAGALRILRGEEAAKTYPGKPVWSGFEDE